MWPEAHSPGVGPDSLSLWIGLALSLLVGVAAWSDWRRGTIPNPLTFGALGLAPLFLGICGGAAGLLASLLGLVSCGLIPFLLFRRGGMGGGDVKLYAAIGAWAGVGLGMEIQFLSFVFASFYAMARLAWRGQLLAVLKNTVHLALRPVLPRARRAEIGPELLHPVRLGPPILFATAIALMDHYRVWWL